MSGAAGAVRSSSYTRRVEERDRRRRLAWSTAIFSLATGLSRVLGLVREIVVANYFGARGPINAFTIAFQIPNLVRALVADAALSGAFVPVFSELLEKGERARAWRVASTIFWLLLLGLTAVTAVFILLAPLIVPLMTDAYDDLAVTLSQILFPIVVLLGLFGVIVGILNSYEQFSIPALTPVFWNLVIIAGVVIGVPRADTADGELYVYAGSIVIATLVQLLLPLPWLYGLDGRLRLALDVRDPAVRRVFVHMAPVTLGLGLINVSAVIGTIFAAKLVDPTIAPNAIDKAFRVYMLPQGMFSVAIATVLFPTLSRLAARADIDGFRATVSLGLRQIVFLLVPAGVASAVLAEPIVRLLYERGEFGPAQTPVDAGADRVTRCRARGRRSGIPDFLSFAGSSRAGGVAIVANPAPPSLASACLRNASVTSRSSRTSTMASRRSPIASSSSPTRSPAARCASRCSTRWSSSASAGSRSKPRRSASSGRAISST